VFCGHAEKALSTPAESIRLVIADGHPISRDGLRWLLTTEPGLVIVGETGEGSRAVTLVREERADILVLDFPTAAGPALEILQQIASQGTSVRTILLADSIDNPDLTRALQLGARGIVLKESTAEVLFKSIHSVMAGHYWIDSDHVADAEASVRKLEDRRRRRTAFGLTRRELDIIAAVVAGSTNKEIAETFSITENTVKSHLSRIFNKLGASNRIELALFAAHHGLLDSQS
jgi:two-component system, NarL family, nitrate/nitrite response regulator NarL